MAKKRKNLNSCLVKNQCAIEGGRGKRSLTLSLPRQQEGALTQPELKVEGAASSSARLGKKKRKYTGKQADGRESRGAEASLKIRLKRESRESKGGGNIWEVHRKGVANGVERNAFRNR